MLQVVRRGPLDDQHYASITDIHVEAALKITSSRDATVRVWESTASLHGIQLNSVQVAREHTNWIMQIEPVQQRFVSVGADAAGVVWRWTQGNDGIEMVRKVYFEDAIESVKCEQGKLIMAGLDEKIAVWDTENFERVEFAKAGKNAKTSFYSVDAKDSVFAAGAVDGIIRVWDSRDPQEEFLRLGKSFVGSTIRSLKISPCGQFILAGGLDGNSQLKLWDIRNIGSGKQSALWSVDVLPEKRSIWSIDCTAGFEKAVVVGNSNQVFLVDLKSQARSKLISLEESDTALRVKFDKSSLETNESIYVCASQGGVIYVPSSSGIPNTLIESGVGIKRAKTLVDNLCIVCENTKGEVSILNALTGKLESYIGTSKTWDQVLKDYKPEFIVSRWFSVDTHLGCLSLSLKYPTCFNASLFVSSIADAPEPVQKAAPELQNIPFDFTNLGEQKINFGELMLSRIFNPRLLTSTSSDQDDRISYDSDYDVYIETTENRLVSLDSIPRPDLEFKLPRWLLDAVISKSFPKSDHKIRFILSPASTSNLSQLSKGDRFTSSDSVTIRRVTMYVIHLLRHSNTRLNAFQQQLSSGNSSNSSLPLPEQIITLSCMGNDLPANLSLKTVHCRFPLVNPLVLEYRLAQ